MVSENELLRGISDNSSPDVGQKIAFIEKDCVLFKGRLRQLRSELRMLTGPSWRVEIITLAR